MRQDHERATYEEIEQDYVRWAAFAQKKRSSAYMAHPDCQDPDHPGCENCEEE